MTTDYPFPYAEGVEAGKQGLEVRDNPYDRSTRDGHAWERGRQWGVYWRSALAERDD